MTLLVHVAGNADLGFTQKADAVADAARARCGELTAGDDPEAAHRLILDLAYTTPVPDGCQATAGLRAPLARELAAVEYHMAAAQGRGGKKEPEGIEVVIVGVEKGSTPTADLAEALTRALRLALQSRAHSGVSGVTVTVHDACVLPDLLEEPNYAQLDGVIGEHTGHVVVPLGGGATNVIMTSTDSISSMRISPNVGSSLSRTMYSLPIHVLSRRRGFMSFLYTSKKAQLSRFSVYIV